MSFIKIDKIDNFSDIVQEYGDIDHARIARIVCISDTHNRHRELYMPKGDVLIHAGDITKKGTIPELRDFNDWLCTLPFKHKVVIGGNHDEALMDTYLNKSDIFSSCTYLQYSSIVLYGWKIYGYPSSTKYFSHHPFLPGSLCTILNYLKPYTAFQTDIGSERHIHGLSDIPSDTDILVSHGPPYGAGDVSTRGTMHGDKLLKEHIEQRIQPKYHIFGHIHEAYGVSTNGQITFINAASPKFPWSKHELNKPIVFDIDIRT